MVDVSIIVPVHHEENNIVKLLEDIQKYVKTSYEVLIIFDLQDDPTVDIAKEYVRKNINQRIFLTKNESGTKKGVVNAIKTGIKKAKGEKSVVVVGDGSDDLRAIDKMSKKISEGYNVVCASRYMRGGKKLGGPFIKTFLSKLAGLSLHYLSKLPTKDPTNTFKTYRTKDLKEMEIESKGGFEYSLELIVKAHLKKLRITEIPTTWKDRTKGESKFKLIKWMPSYLRWYFKAFQVSGGFFLNLYYILLLVVLLFLEFGQIGQNISRKITISSSLDFSWQLDFIERFLHGYIAGKDFIFTYGPLYQLIYSIPSFIFKIPSYLSYPYLSLITVTFVFVLLLALVKLIVQDRREEVLLFSFLLLILGLVSYPSFDIFKILSPLLFSLIFYKTILKKPSLKSYLLIPMLPTLFGAFSYDLFAYSFFISIVLMLVDNITGKNKKIVYKTIFVFFLILFYQFLFSLLLSGNLTYITYSYETSRVFVQTLNAKWSFGQSSTLLIFPIILLFLIYYCFKSKKIDRTKLPIFYVLIFTSFVQMQSIFVRSDLGHIIRSLYPAIIVVFIILYFIARNNFKLLILGIFLYTLIPFKSNLNISVIGLKTAALTLKENKPFSEIYNFSESYKLNNEEINYISDLISKNKEQVLIYPFDNYLLNINNTTYNTLALQLYQYSNSLVEKQTVTNLEENPPKFIILAVDGEGAIDLDQTPNLMRNPIFFSWILSNYSVDSNKKKFLILKLDKHKKIKELNLRKCSFFSLSFTKDKNIITLKDKISGLLKKSIFYISYNDLVIRLPEFKENTQYLIFKDYKNPDSLAELLSSRIDFNDFYEKKINPKQLNLIKYGAFSVSKSFVTLAEEDIKIKCFN